MTTYNTYHSYEEAKISNPENDIYTIDDVFFAVNLRNSARCKPEEECMTVEHFLNEGLIFTEGDLILDCGTVFCVTKTPPLIGNCFTVESSNTIDICDNERYVLRAAALEEKTEGDFWAELESSINEEKPRTKVEYVEVTDSIFDLRPDFEAGELFSKVNHARDYSTINNTQTLAQALHQSCCYRRIETPITEREAFIDGLSDWAEDSGLNVSAEVWDSLFDSGLVKLVN